MLLRPTCGIWWVRFFAYFLPKSNLGYSNECGRPLPQVGHVYASTGGPRVDRVWVTFIGWGIHTRAVSGTAFGRAGFTASLASTAGLGSRGSHQTTASRLRCRCAMPDVGGAPATRRAAGRTVTAAW